MSARATFLGHSAVLLESGEHRVLIDPFLTGNPLAARKAEAMDVTGIVLTHGHADHFGDTEWIAKRCGAPVYAAHEICEFLTERGHDKCEGMNPGGKVETDFGFVALTQAFHSSSYEKEGRYMGMPCGAIVSIGGVVFYHCGDTGLFSDMKLIGEIYRPQVAFVPIGDRYTMGPELASRAAEFIGAKIAIPVHYKTFPALRQEAKGFEPKGVAVRELSPGESIELD